MINRSIVFVLLLISFISCRENTHLLKEIKKLPAYPSASGIEYFENRFYIMGDDAASLLVLDSSFNQVDSIPLFQTASRRISKDTKPDLESVSVVNVKDSNQLLLLGSGSLKPYRNLAMLFNPGTKFARVLRLDSFYRRLINYGIEEINLEGSTAIPGAFLLSNRGHKGYQRNHLIITSLDFPEKQQDAPISIIRIGANNDTNVFNGVSGLAYIPKSDRLLLSVSTEDTRSVYDDGAIGKSYIWIVNNISSKRRWKSINPNQVIDLESVDKRFAGQKIESVCLVKETKRFLHLCIAADNDDGTSTLFRIIVEKD